MPDWSAAMQQTFEFHIVDPDTWKDVKRLTTVKSCTITRDLDADTLGSATIDIDEPVGESYVRVYLITIQNGVREKHALGTFLVQTPASNFNGKVKSTSMDAYTPLIELKENYPEIGYYIPKTVWYSVYRDSDGLYKKYKTQDTDEYVVVDHVITDTPLLNSDGSHVKTITGERVYSYATEAGSTAYCATSETIMYLAYKIILDKARAPKVKADCDTPLNYDYVANSDDTWFSFLNDLIGTAKYSFDLDEMGRILFRPPQVFSNMQPVYTYSDDNSSILYPELDMSQDLFGIPNVLEVTYSDGQRFTVENNDPQSPISIKNRGRRIVHRVTDVELIGIPKKEDPIVEEYAKQLLHELSTVENTLKYTHAYCPVRVGDCVRLNYTRAGLNNVKAKVVQQSIKCEPGCPVSETAVYTVNLYGGEVKNEDAE